MMMMAMAMATTTMTAMMMRSDEVVLRDEPLRLTTRTRSGRVAMVSGLEGKRSLTVTLKTCRSKLEDERLRRRPTTAALIKLHFGKGN